MTNEDTVRRFEEEFKNKANLDIVVELMASDFATTCHIPGCRKAPQA